MIPDLKSENPNKVSKIIPIVGPFHVQISFIYAIYKRFKGGGMADVSVAAGIIAGGSVDQALRSQHFAACVSFIKFYNIMLFVRDYRITPFQDK